MFLSFLKRNIVPARIGNRMINVSKVVNAMPSSRCIRNGESFEDSQSTLLPTLSRI